MSEALIETRALKKHFKTSGGSLHAVDGVDLTIPRGSTLGVVGESGCGKSTLGRVLLKLLEPTSGQILFEGRDIAGLGKRETKKLRKDMQMIFQDPYASLDPRMSVSELIAEPIRLNKILKSRRDVTKRVDELMDTVGLAQRLRDTYPHELDGGRRQRIGIAKALAVDPKFIVCDEPVSALDVSIQAQILNLMMDLQDDMGLTYLFITHDLSVVKLISREIAVMYLGQCVERGPKNLIFDDPQHPYTQALLGAVPVPELGRRTRKRKVLMGEVASPINPAPGCRFAPRCPRRQDACTSADPPLAELADGHFVSCYHPGKEVAND